MDSFSCDHSPLWLVVCTYQCHMIHGGPNRGATGHALGMNKILLLHVTTTNLPGRRCHPWRSTSEQGRVDKILGVCHPIKSFIKRQIHLMRWRAIIKKKPRSESQRSTSVSLCYTLRARLKVLYVMCSRGCWILLNSRHNL